MPTSPAARARVVTLAARRPADPRAPRPGLASEFPKIRTLPAGLLAPRSRSAPARDVSVGTSPAAASAPASVGSGAPPARPGRVSVKLNRLNKTARLPNGMSVHYVSPPDVQFLYDEIYENECYLKHGLTIEPDDVVIDVGGNIGLFAMYAARKCPCGRVFTLEPLPPTYANLRRNVRENLDLGGSDPGRCEDQDDDLPLADAIANARDSKPNPAFVSSGDAHRNNSMDDSDFGDVVGRQLRSRDEREPSASFPDVGERNNLQGECIFLSDEEGDSASAENCSPAGAVWAYNCGVSDGTESSAKFTFYPHAAGWSTMSPDDVETADNVARFVESTLSGDESSTGALHPLASFGRWLLRATRADEKVTGSNSGGDGVFFFGAVARALRSLARRLFSATLALVLKFLLGGRQEFECPLVTVSDIIDSHDLSDVGLLKVDVERAELAVLRGVRKEHWRRVRQVAMEVHDAEGGAKELEAIRALLLDPERGGFEPDRVVVEQPKGLEGSTLWNLYARR